VSPDVAIVDWGGGNVGSMVRALTRAGASVRCVRSHQEAGAADRMVLPGVGHFGAVMQALRDRGLDRLVMDHLASGRPFLGVCVGLQVLFEASEEAPRVPGLGILRGRVVRLNAPKIPHVGFNLVEVVRPSRFLDSDYYYFVNSYHAVPEDPDLTVAVTEYGARFTAAVESGAILAVQFHPEKSGDAGLALLARFLTC